MDFLPQYLFNGLVIGSSYALIAIGLTAIFGLMRIANFAHGQFYMLGAYGAFWFTRSVGLNFWLATVLSVLAVMVLGVLLERTLFRLLRGAPLSSSVLATIALSIFLENLALHVWGPRPQKIIGPFSPQGLEFWTIFTTPDRLLVLAVTAVVVVLLHLGLTHTVTGKSIRATFQNHEAAALVGIDIDKLYTLTFAAGAGLAALAGVLLGSIFVVLPSMGGVATLKAFIVVTLGGLSSFAGGIVGGLVLGIAESLGTIVAPSYKDAGRLSPRHPDPALQAGRSLRATELNRMSFVTIRGMLTLAGLLVLIALPRLIGHDYYLHVAITALVFVILATSLDLLVGISGLLSLGHAAFFAIGAYAAALLYLRLGWPLWINLFASGGITALIAFLLGLLILGARGHRFVIVTIAFAEIGRLVAYNWTDLTNGQVGLPGHPGSRARDARPAGRRFRRPSRLLLSRARHCRRQRVPHVAARALADRMGHAGPA